MEYELNINWLDGYLQGITVMANKFKNQFTCNATYAILPEKDTYKSYIKSINDLIDEEFIGREVSPLVLGDACVINHWIKSVNRNVLGIFGEKGNSDLASYISGQVLDMIELIVSKPESFNVVECCAEMDGAKGTYFFFSLDNHEYFVLSFMETK